MSLRFWWYVHLETVSEYVYQNKQSVVLQQQQHICKLCHQHTPWWCMCSYADEKVMMRGLFLAASQSSRAGVNNRLLLLFLSHVAAPVMKHFLWLMRSSWPLAFVILSHPSISSCSHILATPPLGRPVPAARPSFQLMLLSFCTSPSLIGRSALSSI